METKGKVGPARVRTAERWRTLVGGVLFVGLLALAAVLYVCGRPAPTAALAPQTAKTATPAVQEEPFVPVPQPEPAPPAKPPEGKVVPSGVMLSGVTLNVRNEPIAGARLHLYELSKNPDSAGAPGKEIIATTSDDSGRFEVRCPVTDIDATGHAEADGYLPLDTMVHVPGKDTANLKLVMEEAAGIEGHVVDIRKRPVRDVVVKAMGQLKGRQVVSPPTPDNGSFTLASLDQGHHTLHVIPVAAPGTKGWGTFYGFDKAAAELDLAKGQRLHGYEIVVPMDSDRKLSGTVVGVDGKPIAKAFVWVSHVGLPRDNDCTGVARTGKDGAFRVERMHAADDHPNYFADQVDLHASCAGYATATTAHVPIGSSGVVITLEKGRCGRIEGTVLEKTTRAPIKDAQVLLASVMTDSDERLSPLDVMGPPLEKLAPRVNGDGRFAIEDLQAGTACLVAYAPSTGLSEWSDIRVRSGETTTVELLLDTAGTLNITLEYAGVMKDGKACCTVTCWPKGLGRTSYKFIPELLRLFKKEPIPAHGPIPAGTTTLTLSPGNYEVSVDTIAVIETARSHDSRTYRLVNAEVRPGQTTDLVITVGDVGSMRCTLELRENEERANVWLLPPGTRETALTHIDVYELAALNGYLYTSGAGRRSPYLLNCIPPGNYTAMVIATTKDGEMIARSGKEVTIPSEGELEVSFE